MCPQFTQVHDEAIWCIAALFACCAAMRLARFNVETDEDDDHTMFEGLPSPAAASVVASFAMLSYTLRNENNYVNFEQFDWWLQRLMPPAALVIALLMVSRIPYPHVVTHLVRGQKTFPQLVGIVFTLMALFAVRWYAIPVLCGLYALAPPLVHGWRWTWQHRDSLLRKAS
jgi:CDP-diacylglycerol--serine O-phosphatidyltransferase